MKLRILLLVLCFALSACAPAAAPADTQESSAPVQPTEVVWAEPTQGPANSQESSAPAQPTEVVWAEPTQLPYVQKVGDINFEYKFTYVIPEEWISTKGEKLTFVRQEDGSWSTVEIKPAMRDLSPLFGIFIYESLRIDIDCGVNTYYTDEMPYVKVSFQPVACNFIDESATATITFGLWGCDRDGKNSLVCTRDTEKGVLYYRLNSDLNKFEFTYSGVWNWDYADWIRESLRKLGFKAMPEDFFDEMTPGANYVWYKE